MFLIGLMMVLVVLLLADIFVHWRPSHASDNTDLRWIRAAINNLTKGFEEMSSNIDRIEQEATDLTEDAVVIKQALADLKATVEDLKAQVAAGQLDQARLDAAAAKLEKVDDDLDALTAPTPPTEG